MQAQKPCEVLPLLNVHCTQSGVRGDGQSAGWRAGSSRLWHGFPSYSKLKLSYRSQYFTKNLKSLNFADRCLC